MPNFTSIRMSNEWKNLKWKNVFWDAPSNLWENSIFKLGKKIR